MRSNPVLVTAWIDTSPNAVGRRLAALRGDASTTRVAEEARALGLNWGRETITWIETGRRGLSAEELLLLPLIVTAATFRHVRLAEFLTETVKLVDEVTLTRRHFERILAGEPVVVRGLPPLNVQQQAAMVARWAERQKKARRSEGEE